MKSAPLSRRDRLRHMLADLRLPGALEALDAILQGVDGATLTAPEAIEQMDLAFAAGSWRAVGHRGKVA